MQYPIHTETIEHCGETVRIEYFHDCDDYRDALDYYRAFSALAKVAK